MLAGSSVAHGRISLGEAVVYVQSAVGVSMIAFGGFSWALDGAAAPVDGRPAPGAGDAPCRRTSFRESAWQTVPPGRTEIRFRAVTFAYPGWLCPCLKGLLDLTIPAGSSLAIVGQNGAGKTTLAKLLCRLYDPQSGSH